MEVGQEKVSLREQLNRLTERKENFQRLIDAIGRAKQTEVSQNAE